VTTNVTPTLHRTDRHGETFGQDQSGFVVSVLPGTTLRPIAMKYQHLDKKDQFQHVSGVFGLANFSKSDGF